jgi:hypothetical protein
MPASQTVERHPPTVRAETLAHEIRVDCDRALRRLDRLSQEREDVVLVHAREFIRHAAQFSQAIERDRR